MSCGGGWLAGAWMLFVEGSRAALTARTCSGVERVAGLAVPCPSSAGSTVDADMGTVDAEMGMVDADMGTVDADVGMVDADVGMVDAVVGTVTGGARAAYGSGGACRAAIGEDCDTIWAEEWGAVCLRGEASCCAAITGDAAGEGDSACARSAAVEPG
jgi:hypothetical protein